jgi:hypothetical protein
MKFLHTNPSLLGSSMCGLISLADWEVRARCICCYQAQQHWRPTRPFLGSVSQCHWPSISSRGPETRQDLCLEQAAGSGPSRNGGASVAPPYRPWAQSRPKVVSTAASRSVSQEGPLGRVTRSRDRAGTAPSLGRAQTWELVPLCRHTLTPIFLEYMHI